MTETITIAGKDYPVRISHRAIKAWRIKTKRKIETLGQEPGDLETILLEGLRVGAKLEKQPLKLSLDDIDDWLDEDMLGNMEILTNMISSQFPDAEPSEQITIDQIRQVQAWLNASPDNHDKLVDLLENVAADVEKNG